MKALLEKIRKILRSRRTRQLLNRTVSGIAAIVVFITTYALVLPAITMEQDAFCGIPEHQHTDACYEERLVCGIPESEEHHHDASCYEKFLICGKEVHTHSTECYQKDSSAVVSSGSGAAASTALEAFAEPDVYETGVSEFASGAAVMDSAAGGQSVMEEPADEEAASAQDAAEGTEEVAEGTEEVDLVSEGIASETEDLKAEGTDEGEDAQEKASENSMPETAMDGSDNGGNGLEDTEYTEQEGPEVAGDSDLTAESGQDLAGTDLETSGSGSFENIDADTTNPEDAESKGSEEDRVTVDNFEDTDSESTGQVNEKDEDLGLEAGNPMDMNEDSVSGSDILDNLDTLDTSDGAAEDTDGAETEDTAPAAGTEEAANDATTNVLPEPVETENLSSGYVPELDGIEFGTVLNKHTDFFYFHPEEGQELPASSAEVMDWKKVKNGFFGSTKLESTDLVKMYLSYTIPAGALNETNQVARYRLPSNIHLTDDQIIAINATENGMSALYADAAVNEDESMADEADENTADDAGDEARAEGLESDSKVEDSAEDAGTASGTDEGDGADIEAASDTSEQAQDENAANYQKYLGAEAIEGTRRPDQKLKEGTQEYISAIVKAENVFDEEGLYGEKGAFLGQDLIFIFTPYSIEKNQTIYNADGDPLSAGEKITGWFACDFNMSQIDWVEEDTDLDNSTVEKTAEVVFVEKDSEKKIKEISRTLRLVDVTEGQSDTANGGETAVAAETVAAVASTNEAAKDTEDGPFKSGTLTADGDGYRITLDYTEEAKIPENAELSVREITAETDREAYEACLEQAGQQVAADEKTSVDQKASRFFDIVILVKDTDSEGKEETRKIEPAAPVSVNIQITHDSTSPEDAISTDKETTQNDPAVLHFAEEGVEQIDSTVKTGEEQDDNKDRSGSEKTEPATEISFEAESFSIYGVVYTVDFHYAVNGKMYEFCIPGGGFATLGQLVEVLDIANRDTNSDTDSEDASADTGNSGEFYTEDDEYSLGEESIALNSIAVSEVTKNFVADVANVEFSSPELVWVGKADETTTVGGLKNATGLDVQYSAELTQEQINEINSSTVEGGDWALISVQPFDTEEMLTVAMKDGEMFTILITDAQISKDFITASGETYKITVIYGDDAQIPDGSALAVSEILPENEKYAEYYQKALEKITGKDADSNALSAGYARFFDIEIHSDGQKIEPKAAVDVRIGLADAPADEKLAVVHFEQKRSAEVPVILDTETEKAMDIRFETDSFSVYGVIADPGPGGVTDLDGKSFTISRESRYVMTTTDDIGSNGNGAVGFTKGDESDAPVWQFELVSGNMYSIFTTVDNQTKYMHLEHYGFSRANASLSDTPQEFIVDQVNGGYRLSAYSNGTRYYLDEHNGAGGSGFAGYAGTSDNGILSLNFTQPFLENNQEYMLIVKRSENSAYKYYIILNDGTLKPVQYNESDKSVMVNDPMLWMYTGSNIYHHSMQVAYDGNKLPTDFYYRYIDPTAESGWSEDPDDPAVTTLSPDGQHVTTRPQMSSTALIYENNKIRSTVNNSQYIGVEEVNGTLKISGQASESEAVEILLADAVKVPSVGWTHHTVNHIDISVQGNASADIPLAYGKYYDADHNVVLNVTGFKKLTLTESQVADPEQLDISLSDMKRSSITATVPGPNGPVELDNAFYLAGYSANDAYGDGSGSSQGSDTVQVRIEGSFKVANLDGTEYETVDADRYNNPYDRSYYNAVNAARLNNKVTYTVTVVKPITFNLQMPDPNDTSGNPAMIQLYDADGNPLTVTADVAFAASFDYWDTRNECPPLRTNDYGFGYEKWQAGEIWQVVDRIGGCGMDFRLGVDTSSQTKVYAVEITKLVVDENGNRIKSYDVGTNSFNIYKSSTATSDDVKDLNVGSAATNPLVYSDYDLQHSKSISIGNDGLGLVYDYDVTPSVYYISEDPESITEHITDTSGKGWDYKETYILTEYAWRNHQNDNYMHVSPTYSSGEGSYGSVPEILGDHPGYSDGQIYTNDFLEFYVYNVYESPKVDVPVIKTWEDFEDDQYDWQVSFKLQWAPLYEGEDRPSVSFLDVTPVQTMTINKSDMAGITQELVERYLSGDDTLTEEQIVKIEAITFKNLPKYGTDSNGTTYRCQYSLEETSYRVTNASTGVILYSWSETEGYNDPDESTHYHPFYPHDAGETEEGNTAAQNEEDTNYYIDVRNALRNISQKEYIDIAIDKQWDIDDDDTFDTRDASWWAEFELRRFAYTEHRDLSHMSDADRVADPITITIRNGDTVVDTLQVQPNVGLYLGGNFLPHDSDKTVTFTSDHPVRLANDSRVSTLTVTAAGENQSNALVRSQEFFVTQDTVFTIASGQENLVAPQMARVLDTGAGTSPLPDRTFSQTIRLDNSNNWHTALDDLIRSETSAGDDDDQENVTFYEYYLVEKAGNPKGYAQYFRADSNGNITNVLSGDSDHRIEHDDSIIALNGPSNRLIVKKVWRGVPDTTGFPAVTFTLYQAWANGNEGWVYENPDTHARYEHIELKGNSLEWICPETLPETRLDGSISRAVKYYVVEDVREGSDIKDGITTSWKFYYYINSRGQQTNAGHQGYFAALNGSDLAENGGSITICNEMNNYMQLDIQKQFFRLEETGSWNNITATADMKKNAILGFSVIRAIKAPDGKWLDERGDEFDTPVWMDYGEEMLCGYDENGHAVVHRGENDIFWLHDAGGDWHFRIEDNQGDATNVNAGGAGLPCYGFYIRNGEDIPVEYWYSVRETNVYKDLDRTPYPEWDWFSSITPVNAHGPNGQTMEAFPKAITGQDSNRIANFQASDLLIDKEWDGDPTATAVYVKIWRTSGDGEPEDFTAVIAEDVRNNNNWQMYLTDPSEIDLNRECLIVKPGSDGSWEDAVKVNRALLGTLAENGRYHYFIQEVGYRTAAGEYRTNVNGTYKPLYDRWVGTADDGAYTGTPVGMNDYAGSSITIGAKGENRLKVINRTSPSTSYTVIKSFCEAQSHAGGQSAFNGRYPTDGSKQVVVMLQQRYRYEKLENDVKFVSADNTTWVRADSEDAAATWCNYESNEGWQAAESASPGSIALPLAKPAGSILSDEAWYGSAAAWTYTWEGLDVTKAVSEAADPDHSEIVQMYYRAVEVSTPDWFSSVISAEEQNGHMAIDDNMQSAAGVLSEKNAIMNEREDCTLELNKEWTGLGTGTTWPAGYVVYYQLIQNFHLASTSLNGDTVTYSYGDKIKSVDMQKDNHNADNYHTRATGSLEENNHNLILTGLPMYGFFTATEEDVAAAAEKGVTLTAGTVYPVVYTYSVKETAVKKNGVDVDFTEQTVDFTDKTADGQQTGGEGGQDTGEEPATGGQTETTETGAIYEATLTNEMVSVEVTKTWENDLPYANSVNVKLYRTTEIPADELCLTTINLSFGANHDQITDSTISAFVGGKTVELVKDGDNDLWTGTVRLEKGTDATISFTEPNVSEGYTVTLSDIQFTVPDEETYTVTTSGIVVEQQDGRTITVNVTWTDGNSHSATYNNLFYTGWSNTNISSATSTNGSTQTFIWSGVPTTGNNLFVQLGYNGYNLQNGYTVNVTGSGHSFNGSELLLGDIPAGESNVTINVTIEENEAPPAGTASITLVNHAGYGIWINQLRYNRDYGNFGGWKNNGEQGTISDLPAGSYTVQLGTATVSQISGADSIDQWGSESDPNVNIHITLTDGESRTITVNAPAAANSLMRSAGALRMNSMRLTGDIPVLAQSVSPSSVTVELGHESEAADSTLVTVGADDYPVFTQTDLVEEQTLNAGNNWHYQWTGLAASDPETGAKYYYYVVEVVPANTKTVTYTRSEADNNTVVTIHNTPVSNPEYGSLKVTKSVTDEEKNALDISREFTIRLKRGDQYLNWTDSLEYEWVSSAGDASTWTFNNGGSVTFTGLDTGYTYTVVEDTSTGKIEIDGYTFVSNTGYEVAVSSADEQYEGTITNKYRLNNINLNIIKVDASNMETPLKGAQFTLKKLDPEGKGTYLAGDDAVTKTSGITGDDGTTSVTDIGDGYYEISETKMPDGYILTDSGRFYIKAESGVISLLTFDPDKVVTGWLSRTLTDDDKLQFNSEENTFTVGNTPGAALPATGGPGTNMLYLFGILLTGLAGVGLVMKRRRKNVA